MQSFDIIEKVITSRHNCARIIASVGVPQQRNNAEFNGHFVSLVQALRSEAAY